MNAVSNQIKVYPHVIDRFPEQFFNLTLMETIYDTNNGTTNEPHRHDYYTIIWIKESEGYHQIDFNRYALGHQQVYFVSPGQVHQIHTVSRPRGIVISFNRDFLAFSNISEQFIYHVNLFRPFSENPPLNLDDDTVLKLERITGEIKACQDHPLPFHDHAIGALMKLFLIYCNQICHIDPETGSDQQRTQLVLNFKTLVEQRKHETHKVKDYADELFITPKHLNAVIKSALGYTAKEYIQDRVITEAKRMLLHTSYTMKEIGFHLGFNDPVHFSSFFRKCTGISPSEFKRSNAIQN
jgi:AraC-like DNA-binding protein